MGIKEFLINDINLNPFTIFGTEWIALAAGNAKNGYNAMTIAWGYFGSLWERLPCKSFACGSLLCPSELIYKRIS